MSRCDGAAMLCRVDPFLFSSLLTRCCDADVKKDGDGMEDIDDFWDTFETEEPAPVLGVVTARTSLSTPRHTGADTPVADHCVCQTQALWHPPEDPPL